MPSRTRQAVRCAEFTPEDRPLADDPVFKTRFGYGHVLQSKGSRALGYVFVHLSSALCVFIYHGHAGSSSLCAGFLCLQEGRAALAAKRGLSSCVIQT